MQFTGGMSHRTSPPQQPYGSTRDVPSFREMETQLNGLLQLSRFIGRKQRPQLEELRAGMNRLADTVDRFYEQLGPRHWVFPDNMSVDDIATILDEESDPDALEQRLIGMYRAENFFNYRLLRFRELPDLRARVHLIERARDHYQRDEFDSCTLLLVTVMDGFVNDFQPAVRQGLHARDPDEMTAWDSVTGHHLGLTNILKNTFLQNIKKRRDQEVFEVHRHGIVHGSVVNYDNVIVATKAWNMLFAVQDWARATQKAHEPRDELPTTWPEVKAQWSGIFDQLRANRQDREKLAAWSASTLHEGDDGFIDHPITEQTVDFLEAWVSTNFGRMGSYASRMLGPSRNDNAWAGEARERFSPFQLADFEISEIENSAYAVWIARGKATVNDDRVDLTVRWVLQTDEGRPPVGSNEANVRWQLVNFNPQEMLDPTPAMRFES